MSEWIEWNGGECHVHGGTRVAVVMRGGGIAGGKAGDWYWKHDGSTSDIVRYKIVEQEDPQEECDSISSQPYYLLFPEQNLQVKDVNEAFCNKHDALDERVFSSNEIAWIVQATQYIFRSPFKENAVQDLKKAVEALNIVINSKQERHKT